MSDGITDARRWLEREKPDPRSVERVVATLRELADKVENGEVTDFDLEINYGRFKQMNARGAKERVSMDMHFRGMAPVIETENL